MRSIEDIERLRSALVTLATNKDKLFNAKTGGPMSPGLMDTIGGMLMATLWICGEDVDDVENIFTGLFEAGFVPPGTTKGSAMKQ